MCKGAELTQFKLSWVVREPPAAMLALPSAPPWLGQDPDVLPAAAPADLKHLVDYRAWAPMWLFFVPRCWSSATCWAASPKVNLAVQWLHYCRWSLLHLSAAFCGKQQLRTPRSHLLQRCSTAHET